MKRSDIKKMLTDWTWKSVEKGNFDMIDLENRIVELSKKG